MHLHRFPSVIKSKVMLNKISEMKFKTATELSIDRLFHYTSFTKPERLVRVFTENTIYCSNPKDFNDPWDCRPCFNKEVLNDPKEYDRIVKWFVLCDRKNNTTLSEKEYKLREQELRSNRKLFEWMIDEMTSGMEKAIQSQYRVFCLSIHPDSPLMWSHYGGKHQGICLEFSVRNTLFCTAFQIEYMNRYPIFNLSEVDEAANLMPLVVKSCMWNYEDEFRLVTTESPYTFPDVPTANNGFVSLPKGALQSVIVGCQMNETDRDMVRSLVLKSGWNTELKEARIIPDRFELEIRSLPIS